MRFLQHLVVRLRPAQFHLPTLLFAPISSGGAKPDAQCVGADTRRVGTENRADDHHVVRAARRARANGGESVDALRWRGLVLDVWPSEAENSRKRTRPGGE